MKGDQDTSPSTPSAHPTIEEQKAQIYDLTLSETLKEGDEWYLLAIKWWIAWKEYVHYDGVPSEAAPHPGPVDNKPLVNEKNELLANASERNDFVLVSAPVWNTLLGWYGGGPPISRKVISRGKSSSYTALYVEVRPLVMKIIYGNETFPIALSRADTCGKLKEEICRIKNLNSEDVRVWDYHDNRKLKVLDADERLEDAQILHLQNILVETRKPDGSFPEDGIRSASSDYFSSGGYYGGSRRPASPGLVGLNNLGNTCFMNSSLQCLSNTVPLAEFFLTNSYLHDINAENPLGMKGKLAEEFAKLIRDLWSGQNNAVAPREFKTKLEGFAPQFSGYQQHDSQELLAFLLDGLHEDLNRVKKKPYVEMKEADGRPDEEVAKEAWSLHKSRNDSIVVDWFQGQLKSTLVCPECSRISVTFDPFMYLSLPLPMKMTRTLMVTFFPLRGTETPVKYGVKLPKYGNIADLKATLSDLCRVPADGLVVTEVYNYRFFKKFNDGDAVDSIQDRDIIHAYEIFIPTEESDQDIIYCPVYQLKESGGYSSYNYSRRSMFGVPFIISVPAKITYDVLYNTILDQVQRYLKIPVGKSRDVSNLGDTMSLDDDHQQNDVDSSSGYASDGEDMEDDSDGEGVSSLLQKQKGRVALPATLSDTSAYGSFFDIMLIDSYGQSEKQLPRGDLELEDRQHLAIYWNSAVFNSIYDSELEKEINEHPSANEDESESNNDITLDRCLELFTATEKLGPDDPWYCSKCKDFRQATKKFDLWNAPPVLVIHLKRFSYRNKYWREKLETHVNYPVRGLDLSRHLICPPNQPPVYDLYAVSNHYGSMGGGHYTAYALNKTTHKWYKFDDSYVTEVDESHVVTSSGYVLFYKRRDDQFSLSAAPTNNVLDSEEDTDEDTDTDATVQTTTQTTWP
jgi:ubiquitin carboxyl-terminal hydrolase 4/11/15